MPLTAEQILIEVRALPPAKRLWLVEQIVHDLAAERTPASAQAPIWGDEDDADFEAFQIALKRRRDADVEPPVRACITQASVAVRGGCMKP